MNDPLEALLRDVTAPKALAPALRERLEALLVAGALPALEEFEGASAIAGADAPRPVPLVTRRRLEGRLGRGAANVFARLDEERPLPAAVRARLEATLLETPSRRAVTARALAAAASIILVIGAVTVGTLDRQQARDPSARPSVAPSGGTTDGGTATIPEPPQAGKQPPRPISGGHSVRVPVTDGAALGSSAADAPPPFTSDPTPGFSFAPPESSHPAAPRSPRPSPAPLRISIVRGDRDIDAGFRGYIALLNERGGAAGHRIDLVEARPPRRDGSAIATVNLGTASIAGRDGAAPAWAPKPILETIAAPEPVLARGVYSLGSAPERQAHLLAEAIYPDHSASGTVVVYHGAAEPWLDTVPDAYEEVLRERGLTVIRVAVRDAEPLLLPADAALLSLDARDAERWARAARDAGYAPARGVAGIHPLFDESLVRLLPSGTRVISPYALTTGEEMTTFRARVDAPVSARAIHGWVTAKALALAIWRSEPDTAKEMRAAIAGLEGFDPRFAPRLDFRPGTGSRTPEGVLLVVADGRFRVEGGFRADSR